ncbi:MAG: pyroglutamyl-peptidase I, partial [Clostridia bacterium]|nr:pyroglutamyl-peptidase I [Clostridia bacterium]
HVPFLHEQVLDKKNMPSLSKADIVKGIEAAIEAIVQNKEELKTVGGEID